MVVGKLLLLILVGAWTTAECSTDQLLGRDALLLQPSDVLWLDETIGQDLIEAAKLTESRQLRASTTMVSGAVAGFSYEQGDIPVKWASLVSTTTLEDFNGQWRLSKSRSESPDAILSGIGIPPVKRRLVSNFEGITDITVWPQSNKVVFHTYLPAKHMVAATIPVDGSEFVYEDPETGSWVSRAIFHNGKLAQYRKSMKGEMYDVRAVFQVDPLGLSNGPVMLFCWTFIPAGSNEPLKANRWLLKEY